MKKFNFSLQSVLDYAMQQEEMARTELNRLLARQNELEMELQQTQALMRKSKEELQGRKEIFPYEISLYERYFSRLEQRRLEIMAQQRELNRQIENQRQQVVAATQKRRMFERLRERQATAYQQDVDRFLQQEADDLFLQRRHPR